MKANGRCQQTIFQLYWREHSLVILAFLL